MTSTLPQVQDYGYAVAFVSDILSDPNIDVENWLGPKHDNEVHFGYLIYQLRAIARDLTRER